MLLAVRTEQTFKSQSLRDSPWWTLNHRVLCRRAGSQSVLWSPGSLLWVARHLPNFQDKQPRTKPTVTGRASEQHLYCDWGWRGSLRA